MYVQAVVVFYYMHSRILWMVDHPEERGGVEEQLQKLKKVPFFKITYVPLNVAIEIRSYPKITIKNNI